MQRPFIEIICATERDQHAQIGEFIARAAAWLARPPHDHAALRLRSPSIRAEVQFDANKPTCQVVVLDPNNVASRESPARENLVATLQRLMSTPATSVPPAPPPPAPVAPAKPKNNPKVGDTLPLF